MSVLGSKTLIICFEWFQENLFFNLHVLFILQMSLTIQQIILDAKRLASRLKEHDSAADALLSQTQSVYKQIDAMKQVMIFT